MDEIDFKDKRPQCCPFQTLPVMLSGGLVERAHCGLKAKRKKVNFGEDSVGAPLGMGHIQPREQQEPCSVTKDHPMAPPKALQTRAETELGG